MKQAKRAPACGMSGSLGCPVGCLHHRRNHPTHAQAVPSWKLSRSATWTRVSFLRWVVWVVLLFNQFPDNTVIFTRPACRLRFTASLSTFRRLARIARPRTLPLDTSFVLGDITGIFKYGGNDHEAAGKEGRSSFEKVIAARTETTLQVRRLALNGTCVLVTHLFKYGTCSRHSCRRPGTTLRVFWTGSSSRAC